MPIRKKSLLEEFPDLSKEWHQILNNDLKPSDFTSGSGEKVWWQCQVNSDHTWNAAIYSRKGGSGCPYCSGLKAYSGNSLAKTFPDIASDWDQSKNGKLTPDDVKAGSNKKVWWCCPKDPKHTWETTVFSRTSGAGCPFCSGRKATSENNLEVKFPEVSNEWHPTLNKGLKPENFTPKSGKKIWWLCSNDNQHDYEARISHRTGSQSGCPYCVGQKINDTNSFAQANPELVAEWHSTKNGALRPETFAPKNTKHKIWWVCKKDPEHEWQTTTATRSAGHGCPYCSNNSSAPELRLYAELQNVFNQVVNRHKINGIEIDIFLPDINVGIEYDGSYWHSGKDQKDQDKNRLLSALNVSLIRVREDPLKLLAINDITVSYKTFVKTDVDKILTKIGSITNKYHQQILAYVEKKQFQADKQYQKYLSNLPNPIPERSLEATHPKICELWDYDKNTPLTPKNFTAGTNKKVHWVCKANPEHRYSQNINSTVTLKGSCPICSGKQVHKTNSLATLRPQIAAEWDHRLNGILTANDVVIKSNKKVWWRCQKNSEHSWEVAVAQRTVGSGCPFCSGRKADSLNNLEVKFPEVSKEWHPVRNGKNTPSKTTSVSGSRVWWKCAVNPNHSWSATVASRTSSGTGCPYCSGRMATNEHNLKIKFPEVSNEWHPTLNKGLKPENFTPKSGKKIWWICAKDHRHIFEQQIHRRVDSSKCPYCAGKKVNESNSLAALRPDISAQWHPTKNGKIGPETVTIGSGKSVWWICNVQPKHIWEARVGNRTVHKDRGCPHCTKN